MTITKGFTHLSGNRASGFCRALFFILLVPFSHAQVPDWPEYARYVVYDSGDIVYVPATHEVIIQPKGEWNTAPFAYPGNIFGVEQNRWPFLDALCKYFEQPVVGPTPTPGPQPVCQEPNYVVKP